MPSEPCAETTALTVDERVDAAVADVGRRNRRLDRAPTTLEFQIAVAPQPGAEVTESLAFVLNGKEIPAPTPEISGDHGNRIHKFDVEEGNLKVSYSATVVGQTDPAPRPDIDLSTYLRPSRYAEADKFFGFAATEFGDTADSADAAGEGVVLGGHPAELRPRVVRTRSTAPPTPCSQEPGCAVTTRIW